MMVYCNDDTNKINNKNNIGQTLAAEAAAVAAVAGTKSSCYNKRLLPFNFRPLPYTVIIGRGKEPRKNPGNKRLKLIARTFLEKYQKETKRVKTRIVSNIISMIYKACGRPNGVGVGAFVMHDIKNDVWYEVLSSAAIREKVSYVFRDLLADQYKSSSKSKVAQRQRGRYQRKRHHHEEGEKDEEHKEYPSPSEDDTSSSVGSSSRISNNNKNDDDDDDDSGKILQKFTTTTKTPNPEKSSTTSSLKKNHDKSIIPSHTNFSAARPTDNNKTQDKSYVQQKKKTCKNHQQSSCVSELFFEHDCESDVVASSSSSGINHPFYQEEDEEDYDLLLSPTPRLVLDHTILDDGQQHQAVEQERLPRFELLDEDDDDGDYDAEEFLWWDYEYLLKCPSMTD